MAIVANSGVMPLYIWAGPIADSGIMPLYVATTETKNKGIPLFMSDNTVRQSETNEITLHTEGTTTSGWQFKDGLIPLFTRTSTTSETTAEQTNNITLFMPVPTSGTTTKTVTLKITGYTYKTIDGGINLVLGNDVGKYQSAPLYIFGIREDEYDVEMDVPLENYGSVPSYKRITLFINRPNHCVVFPMYLKTMTPLNSYINMYMDGTYIATSGIPLVIAEAISSGVSLTNLFISGY